MTIENVIMNTKSHLKVVENKANKELKLTVYGYIGGWRNSAQNVLEQLENSNAETINVHINSGGSAFDGIAISNILKNHQAKIVVRVDGWAASAASIICMGADKVVMPSNTLMMIHKASTFGYGNADDFEKAATDLRKIDKAVAASYKSRFVGEEEELTKLLNEETWLNADEAVALGFADEVTNEVEYKRPIDDEEVEPKNLKDSIVAKYKKEESNNEKDKQPADDKSNIARLFF